MVPMNLLRASRRADFVNTGSWAKKAIAETDRIGTVRVVASSEPQAFTEIPDLEQLPLAEDAEGNLIAADAKIGFDDNAAFRQKEVHDQRDYEQEDPREVAASKWDLNYIGLDGSIGCMVNGAGLAMSTMDIVQLKGGSPANFLDVGGGANVDQIKAAFDIITSDPSVKAILVNIFGGIMKCDIIAEGIVQASKELELTVPVVVRLEGTNVERGQEILKESGLDFITASDLDDAAEKAVAAIA